MYRKREIIDQMIEMPEERGNIVKFARKLTIDPRTAERWWKVIKRLERCLTKNRRVTATHNARLLPDTRSI
ncbi:unnamed protein product [Rhizopus stolonifer]